MMFGETIRTSVARWLTAHALVACLLCANALQATYAQPTQISVSESSLVQLSGADIKSIQLIPVLASYLDGTGKLTVDQIAQTAPAFLPLDPNKVPLIGDGALQLLYFQ